MCASAFRATCSFGVQVQGECMQGCESVSLDTDWYECDFITALDAPGRNFDLPHSDIDTPHGTY